MPKSNRLQSWYHHNITKGQKILLWIVAVFLIFLGLAAISEEIFIGFILFLPLAFLVYLALGSKS